MCYRVWRSISFTTTLELALFLKLPRDVALVLSRQQHTRDLVDDLSHCTFLDEVERDLL